MTDKQKRDMESAEKFVREFARQLPGSFDFGEGVKCFEAGIELERKRSEGLSERPGKM